MQAVSVDGLPPGQLADGSIDAVVGGHRRIGRGQAVGLEVEVAFRPGGCTDEGVFWVSHDAVEGLLRSFDCLLLLIPVHNVIWAVRIRWRFAYLPHRGWPPRPDEVRRSRRADRPGGAQTQS